MVSTIEFEPTGGQEAVKQLVLSTHTAGGGAVAAKDAST